MKRYVALLGGINVGGNRKVPMADLKKTLEGVGFENVKTLLASGNVAFDSGVPIGKLEGAIEKALEEKFGFFVTTLVRPHDEIVQLVKRDPFKSIKVTNDTRLYVTFTRETPKIEKGEIEGVNVKLVGLGEREILYAVTLVDGRGTIEAMDDLRKRIGKEITTRNWNTVVKISKI